MTRSFKLVLCVRHAFELWTAPAWVSQRLRRDFPQLQIAHLPDYKRLTEEIGDAEVFVGWSLRAEQVAAAKKLRWVHSTAAAVHQLLLPELVASDVVLTNSSEVHGPVVAEHALALILALAKRIPSAVRLQQRGEWGQTTLWEERPRPREVAGATLGVVGLGSIGRELVRSARALEMRVVAVREHPEKGSGGADAVYGPEDLGRLLAEADFVVLAAPLTEKSRALMNAERLAQMRPDAFLINVSRGALVDEAALAAALEKHTIAGAALDVFATEPLPAESPLWGLENLLITPHTAAVTERLWERHYELLADNLRRYLAGEPLRGVVDKSRGY
ncbi:MAG: D-2-hydroxyacid dehydrogenase [Terriglobales bacterium]